MIRPLLALAFTASRFCARSSIVKTSYRSVTGFSRHSRTLPPAHHSSACSTPSMSSRRRASSSKRGDDNNDDSPSSTPSSSLSPLAQAVIDGIHDRASPQTKAWFTNYVKGTTWIGCKMPMVRESVKEAVGGGKTKTKKENTKSSPLSPDTLLDAAIELLQHNSCDVKLGGMLILSEQMNVGNLATSNALQRLENDVLLQNKLDDWSSADWFATKVLRNIVFYTDGENNNDDNDDNNFALPMRVLNYTNIANTKERNYLYVRRCGVVAFLDYPKHRDKLPPKFGQKLIDACERSILTSPDERFTQTGIAWVLRYVLLEEKEKDAALDMIVRHGALWTKEAKKSLVEKLPKKDPRRKRILELE